MELDERGMIADLPMTLSVPASFGGGIVLGFAYFWALRETARLIVSGGHPALGLALTLGRLGLIGAVFYVAVLAGGAALIAALAGVLVAKAVMLQVAP
ncbi:MAG: hypothetical protein ACI9U6_001849 [Loktanella salsilacus]|jgi:hypothetical protein|uniref:N-ATPase subunit AtpR n=1 Tax=Loktanella salsilacus TaxID=195913 RepID=UPI00398A2DEE